MWCCVGVECCWLREKAFLRGRLLAGGSLSGECRSGTESSPCGLAVFQFERLGGLPLRSCIQANAEAARLPFFVVGVWTIRMWVGPLQLAGTALLSVGPGFDSDLSSNMRYSL